eukprot:1616784-Rhodomonas_salina.3
MDEQDEHKACCGVWGCDGALGQVNRPVRRAGDLPVRAVDRDEDLEADRIVRGRGARSVPGEALDLRWLFQLHEPLVVRVLLSTQVRLAAVYPHAHAPNRSLRPRTRTRLSGP